MAKREEIEYNDRTVDYGGGRIPSEFNFYSVWLTNPLELKEFYAAYLNSTEFRKKDIGDLSHQEKLAVTRHRKALEKKLGLRNDEKGRKLIYQNTPFSLLVDEFIEKKNTFVSKDGTTILKKGFGCYAEYTDENINLMHIFHNKIQEAQIIKKKLFHKGVEDG